MYSLVYSRVLVVSVLLIAFLYTSTAANGEEPFESFPHIKCEACLAIGAQLGEKMNETSKVGATIQSSHRLEHNNKPRREDYDSSELRAVEVMEDMCTGIHNVYYLRITPEGRRFFSKNKEDKRSPFYGDLDKEVLGAPSKRLETFCQQFADEHDEEITAAIRKHNTLEGLQHQLCTKSLKFCGTKAVSKSLEKEGERRVKYLKKRDAKRKKVEAEKKRKEEEEKKAEEEKKMMEAQAEEIAPVADENVPAQQAEQVPASSNEDL